MSSAHRPALHPLLQDLLLFLVLMPLLFGLLMNVLSGDIPEFMDYFMGALFVFAPMYGVALAAWYLVVWEWRWSCANPVVRNALRALKATWVLAFPGILMGARAIPIFAAVGLAACVATYVLLRARLQRGTMRL